MSDAESPTRLDLSVVVPVRDEEGNLDALHAALMPVLESTGRRFEVLYIDDGSADGSAAILETFARADPRVAMVRLRKNFGQTAALAAGFDHARGAVIVTLDADLQNDPRDIPRLLARLDEGHDVVSGWRRERHDDFWSRTLPSRAANALIARITGLHLHDYGCTLKAYRREVLQGITLYGELHRFLPALTHRLGVRVAEEVVAHHPRKSGASKYGMARVPTVLLDLITIKFLLSYATRPIQIFGGLGLGSIALGLLTGLLVLAMKLAANFDITGNPLFLGAIFLVLVGVQLIVLGLMAEIMIRVYHEGQGRRIYAVDRIVRGGAEERP